MDNQTIAGLNTAFNEAKLLGFEIDKEECLVIFTLAVICTDNKGAIPKDNRVQVVLSNVSKLISSLSNKHHENGSSEIISFSHDKILNIVQSFGGLPIYGWEFFDADNKRFDRWKNKLSLFCEMNSSISLHTLDLFQYASDKSLDIRIWFNDIQLFTPDYKEILIKDFIAAGQNAWDAIMIAKNKEVQDAFNIRPSSEYKFERKQRNR